MSDTNRGEDSNAASEPSAKDESLLGAKGDPVEGARDIPDKEDMDSAAADKPD